MMALVPFHLKESYGGLFLHEYLIQPIPEPLLVPMKNASSPDWKYRPDLKADHNSNLNLQLSHSGIVQWGIKWWNHWLISVKVLMVGVGGGNLAMHFIWPSIFHSLAIYSGRLIYHYSHHTVLYFTHIIYDRGVSPVLLLQWWNHGL